MCTLAKLTKKKSNNGPIPALLIIAIGAFHIAQMRVVNHYDVQMLPVLKRLNIITVALLSGMVFFATFAIN